VFAIHIHSFHSKIPHVIYLPTSNTCTKIAYIKIGDAVPLWNFNIVEAGVTIVCACLFGSKPVVMILIPDRLIAKLKSISRYSLPYHRSNLIPQARSRRGRTSVGSALHSDEASPFALRGQPNRDGRHDSGKYGTPSHYVFLDDSRPISEPVRAIVHNDNGK